MQCFPVDLNGIQNIYPGWAEDDSLVQEDEGRMIIIMKENIGYFAFILPREFCRHQPIDWSNFTVCKGPVKKQFLLNLINKAAEKSQQVRQPVVKQQERSIQTSLKKRTVSNTHIGKKRSWSGSVVPRKLLKK